MAIFLVKLDDGRAVVVRARCLSCARQVAAEYAADGDRLKWLGGSVELIRPSDHTALILRGKQ